jgi:hypothetical protein
VTTAGNFAQWYFADPGLRSDSATASIITFFSSGVRSRWPILTPAEAGGVSLDARGVCPVVHSESAKPTANRAIKLKLDICKARESLRRALYFVREQWQIFGSVPKAAIRCALSRWQHQGASARHRSTHAAASLWGCCVKGTRRASPSTTTTSATAWFSSSTPARSNVGKEPSCGYRTASA